jgi:formylglycine-generating enzyme required for sulfatase activity
LETKDVNTSSEKTYMLVVRIASFRGNKPIKNVNVKVFMVEKTPITLQQWTENLKNGTPFKRLLFSMNTDNNGSVTAELGTGSYEVVIEKYGLKKACELSKDETIVFNAPKKRWWQES